MRMANCKDVGARMSTSITERIKVLKDARTLLSDPKNWTRDEFARDYTAKPTLVNSESAVCFCTMGAVERVSNVSRAGDVIRDLYQTLICDPYFSGYSNIAQFNDRTSHTKVLELFDKTIVRLEQ